jgi:hypothetical protein
MCPLTRENLPSKTTAELLRSGYHYCVKGPFPSVTDRRKGRFRAKTGGRRGRLSGFFAENDAPSRVFNAFARVLTRD